MADSLYTNRNCYQEAKDASVSGTIYYGQAEHGSKAADAKWRIWKDVTVDGLTYTTFPDVDGDEQCFRFVWDDRASITFFDPTT